MIHTPIHRRAALRIGGAGLFGLSLPQLLQASDNPTAKKSRVKSVIFLHQWGGPGQHETFDMKPDSPDNIRGWHKPVSTKVPDIHICEKLPLLGKLTDQLCIIRCMQHDKLMKNHNSAGYYSLTGMPPVVDDIRLRDTLDLFPAYGSIVNKLSPSPEGVAGFVSFPHQISDGSITPGQHASFLGKTFNPLFINEDPNQANFQLPELSLPDGMTPERLQSRTEMLKLIDQQSYLLEQSVVAQGLDQSYQKAIAMLTSPKFKEAFDLTKEKKETRDRYGRTTYGQSCLLARRVVEAGAKFVNVYFSRSIGGANQGWDYHGFRGEKVPDRLKELLPLTDQVTSALIEDLKDRGLFDSTLVVWVGEFGRTPKISSNGGRDHWPSCYTAVLFGGGTKGGYVHGKSDKIGGLPIDGRVTPEDLAATMFDALGLDHEAEIRDNLNRPLPISRGTPVRELFL